MHTNLVTPSLMILVLAIAGCEKKNDSKQTPREAMPASASAQAHQHAPLNAKHGTHEDWCGGHQVPESLCTRCNPSLIAAFKATGDWCEEHGLPESQCLRCNPDQKIERPPRAKAN